MPHQLFQLCLLISTPQVERRHTTEKCNTWAVPISAPNSLISCLASDYWLTGDCIRVKFSMPFTNDDVCSEIGFVCFSANEMSIRQGKRATGSTISITNQAVTSVPRHCETKTRRAPYSVQGGFSSILKHGLQRVMMNCSL